MSKQCTVIYNGDCPICAREIEVYRARAGAGVAFVDLNGADLSAYGLTSDEAARQLYVVRDGRVLAGVDAFLALWRETPGFGWLARLVDLPGVRLVAGGVYGWVLAPVLFAMHKRRQARGA